MTYLPENNTDKSQVFEAAIPDAQYANLESVVPDTQKRAYDVHHVIYGLIDKDSFFEIQQDYAKNVVVGLARINGVVTGVVANQPCVLAGALDCNASDKAARFVRFCDCFGIQILSLVDVPGYLPGKEQEHSGIIRHGAKLLYAYSEATVPKESLILRKAFGGAYIAMNSKHMGADTVYAWPISQIAVMGAEGAVPILFRKQLENCSRPEEEKKKIIADYEAHFLNPYIAASRGYVDEVILPEETRNRAVKAFEMLSTKTSEMPWKKQGNIPL